jgi:hypothetical protein
MAATYVPRAYAAVTADTTLTGVVTVGSTTPFQKGAICYLNGTGQPGVEVKVVAILSATTMSVRATRAKGTLPPWDISFAGTAQPAGTQAPSYGTNGPWAGYTLANGTSITQPSQQVFGDGTSTDSAAFTAN